jgi:monovalent cation/proton antiporter MnhG/PhaG subunit
MRLGDHAQRLTVEAIPTGSIALDVALGVGGLLIASMAHFVSLGAPDIHELLITLFLFITAPVSAHMLAKAALHLGLPSRAPLGGSLRKP